MAKTDKRAAFDFLPSFKSAKLKTYSMWLGVTMGILLVALSLMVDILVGEGPVTLREISTLFRKNPVHWIIATSPFFLGTIFYLLGAIISDRERRIESAAVYEHQQFKLLQDFISGLHTGNLTKDLGEAFDNGEVREQLNQFRRKLLDDRVAEERRGWESEGLARFGELLRSHQQIDALSLDVLRFLIRYTGANQGSVFILDSATEEPALTLKACYAYDRKKFVTGRVEPGQGLVGQVFLEKETTVLLDIPRDYVRITSGLGEAPPTFIAIVPMKSEESVNGVMEIASFARMEPYQIAFLEKACDAFATVVASVTTAENVHHLLHESQQRTEELRAQEEELRQNMEELQAVQEQMARQLEESQQLQRDLKVREEVMEQTTILSETDLYGTITYVNDKFCEVSGFSRAELLGKPHKVVRHPDTSREVFARLWSTIKKGRIFRGIIKNRKRDGGYYWVDATIVPIYENGKVVKYVGARYHLQNDKIAEQLYAEQLRSFSSGAEEELVLSESLTVLN